MRKERDRDGEIWRERDMRKERKRWRDIERERDEKKLFFPFLFGFCSSFVSGGEQAGE